MSRDLKIAASVAVAFVLVVGGAWLYKYSVSLQLAASGTAFATSGPGAKSNGSSPSQGEGGAPPPPVPSSAAVGNAPTPKEAAPDESTNGKSSDKPADESPVKAPEQEKPAETVNSAADPDSSKPSAAAQTPNGWKATTPPNVSQPDKSTPPKVTSPAKRIVPPPTIDPPTSTNPNDEAKVDETPKAAAPIIDSNIKRVQAQRQSKQAGVTHPGDFARPAIPIDDVPAPNDPLLPALDGLEDEASLPVPGDSAMKPTAEKTERISEKSAGSNEPARKQREAISSTPSAIDQLTVPVPAQPRLVEKSTATNGTDPPKAAIAAPVDRDDNGVSTAVVVPHQTEQPARAPIDAPPVVEQGSPPARLGVPQGEQQRPKPIPAPGSFSSMPYTSAWPEQTPPRQNPDESAATAAPMRSAAPPVVAKSVPISPIKAPTPFEGRTPIASSNQPVGSFADSMPGERRFQSVPERTDETQFVSVENPRVDRREQFVLVDRAPGLRQRTPPRVPEGPKVEVSSFTVQSYVVLPGDTYDSIARTLYGSEQYAPALLHFNRSKNLRDQPVPEGTRVRYSTIQVLERQMDKLTPEIAQRYRRYSQARTNVATGLGQLTREVRRPNDLARRIPAAVVADRETPQVTPTAGQTPSPAAGPTYTTTREEPLYGIAKRFLGDGTRWREIYELNIEILPNKLLAPAAATLRLPPDAKIVEEE